MKKIIGSIKNFINSYAEYRAEIAKRRLTYWY